MKKKIHIKTPQGSKSEGWPIGLEKTDGHQLVGHDWIASVVLITGPAGVKVVKREYLESIKDMGLSGDSGARRPRGILTSTICCLSPELQDKPFRGAQVPYRDVILLPFEELFVLLHHVDNISNRCPFWLIGASFLFIYVRW